MLDISVVVGNPRRNSRTGSIAVNLVNSVFSGEKINVSTIELADYVDDVLKWPSPRMSEVTDRILASGLVVFATPTYKASYTGLLKSLLDRYPANGLSGVIAIPVMTGADFSHSMAPNVNLVPLLLELGATVPVAGLYFNTGLMDQMDDIIRAKAREVARALTSLDPVIGTVRHDAHEMPEAGHGGN